MYWKTYFSTIIDNFSLRSDCPMVAKFLKPSFVIYLSPSDTTWTIWLIFFINIDISKIYISEMTEYCYLLNIGNQINIPISEIRLLNFLYQCWQLSLSIIYIKLRWFNSIFQRRNKWARKKDEKLSCSSCSFQNILHNQKNLKNMFITIQ